MGARTGWCLLNVLVAVSLAIAVMAGVPARVVAATPAFAQASSASCHNPPGWKPTKSDLYRILARHRGWLQINWYRYFRPPLELESPDRYLDRANPDWRHEARSHPEQAKLCDADLRGADLHDADLNQADLRGADLTDAHLEGAHLEEAHLTAAHLRGANLRGADLEGADLEGAHLERAHLERAHLFRADLEEAHLTAAHLGGADLAVADLRDADLNGAQVSKAELAYADLTGAFYAPVSEPPAPYVAGIRGLSTLHAARGEEIGLVQLRKLLQDAGLRDDERAATCAIERNRTRDQLSRSFWSFAWIGGASRFVAFDITTAYGLHPGHALGLIVLLGAVLTPVYMWAILHPTATSRIVQVFPEDRLDETAGDSAAEKERKKTVQAKTWRDALWPAAYFSLISAANIGFEQFTPGDWIRRLQAREYSLEAVGRVRKVAGAQALLSVFLLAMWALTQFGRPFG
jgi:hypothetical protein